MSCRVNQDHSLHFRHCSLTTYLAYLNNHFSSATGGYNLVPTPPSQGSELSGNGFEEAQGVPIVSLKPGSDNATPSPNGIIAINLLLLSSYLDDTSYKNLAKKAIDAFAIEIIQHPFLFVSFLSAVVLEAVGVKSVVAVGDAKVDQLSDFGRTIIRLHSQQACEWLGGRNKPLDGLEPRDGEKGRVMIWEAGTCREIKDGRVISCNERGECSSSSPWMFLITT